jgi:hypothetical protein
MRFAPLSSLFASAFVLFTSVLGWSACTRKGDVDPISKPLDPAGSSSAKPDDSGKPITHTGPVPESHRARPSVCRTETVKGDVESNARGDVADDSRAECKKDSECTAGKNGRCAMYSGGHGRVRPHASCVYDKCFKDADCGAKSECVCSDHPGAGHFCRGGDCATDADCGTGYCSPSFGLGCGAYGGVAGNFCHVPADECTNDSECTKDGRGYCAFNPEVKHWVCGYGHCVG